MVSVTVIILEDFSFERQLLHSFMHLFTFPVNTEKEGREDKFICGVNNRLADGFKLIL